MWTIGTAPEVLAEAPDRIRRPIADKGYEANRLRKNLCEHNTTPIIPGSRARNRKIRLAKKRYRERWRAEATFCRLKDLRRTPPATTNLPATSLRHRPSHPSLPSGAD